MSPFDPKLVELAKLSERDLGNLASFDCGDEEINRFLRDEAFREQELGFNTTILLYYGGELAAFVSTLADSILLHENEKDESTPYASVPAIKIGRLGTDKRFQGLGLGAFLVKYVFGQAIEVSENYCGVRMVTLDAYPNRVSYYESLGFVRNQHSRYSKRTKNVSMRYDIYEQAFRHLEVEQEETEPVRM